MRSSTCMKLSIITINYNNCEGLRKTIESVVNQTWRDFEYIIIDGGSTDGSVDVIKEYANRIDYWVSEPDRGIYHAMNKGIDVAKGEYCIFMNSGDSFINNGILEDVIKDVNSVDIISSQMKYTDGRVMTPPAQISMKFLYTSTLPHQATFIRTNVLKQIRYDESFRIVSDWKFWIEALIVYNHTYKSVNVPVTLFDAEGISLTNKSLDAIEREEVLNSFFPLKIIEDYERFEYGSTNEEILYIAVQKSKFRRFIYTLIVSFFKLASIHKKNHWVKRLPLFLK